jgi:hypothetical protein
MRAALPDTVCACGRASAGGRDISPERRDESIGWRSGWTSCRCSPAARARLGSGRISFPYATAGHDDSLRHTTIVRRACTERSAAQ